MITSSPSGLLWRVMTANRKMVNIICISWKAHGCRSEISLVYAYNCHSAKIEIAP